ncbi:MAG TPA: VOC family protein [Nitrososphaeraceae archaeon]|nr:VOC family protein [Nitrososphaeraceae archaeon]
MESTEPFEITPDMSVANVKLQVSSIETSLRFYHDILGFQLVGKTSDDSAFLSPVGSNNKNYLLHLSKIDTTNILSEEEESIRNAGLYHFAILLPSRRHLANIFKHLTKTNQLYFEGAADHGVSESLYLRDPDSNGVEIYRDRPSSEWIRTGKFQIEMKTDNLNLKQLLKEAEDKEWNMPADTVIGHIHLQVSDLIKSSNFYSNVLGLHHTCSYPGANFFAADSYHHHIAINSWSGNGLSIADLKKPGLDHFSLNLGFKEKFDELLNHIQRMKIQMLSNDISEGSNQESFFILDPNRIKIMIYYQ